MNTYTVKIRSKDVYDLFQKVYESASRELVSVYIDVEELTATFTMKIPEASDNAIDLIKQAIEQEFTDASEPDYDAQAEWYLEQKFGESVHS